jgi:SEC-C motif-containing protein
MNNSKEWVPGQRESSLCPCKSQLNYGICCKPYHNGKTKPDTAEQLMRSRFSAYFFRKVEYLVETTHPDTREKGLKEALDKSIHQTNWSFLTISGTSRGGKDDKTGKVEFVADYFVGPEQFELHEISRFKRHKGVWKYLDDKG